MIDISKIHKFAKEALATIDYFFWPSPSYELVKSQLSKALEIKDPRDAQKYIQSAKMTSLERCGHCDELSIVLGDMDAALYGGDPWLHTTRYSDLFDKERSR